MSHVVHLSSDLLSVLVKANCFVLLVAADLCTCSSRSYLGSLMSPRGFPRMLPLVIPLCCGLNISYALSGHPFDFEVAPRYNWGKEKWQIVEHLCLHVSFFLLLFLLISCS